MQISTGKRIISFTLYVATEKLQATTRPDLFLDENSSATGTVSRQVVLPGNSLLQNDRSYRIYIRLKGGQCYCIWSNSILASLFPCRDWPICHHSIIAREFHRLLVFTHTCLGFAVAISKTSQTLADRINTHAL